MYTPAQPGSPGDRPAAAYSPCPTPARIIIIIINHQSSIIPPPKIIIIILRRRRRHARYTYT
jgi:hypothetical protein